VREGGRDCGTCFVCLLAFSVDAKLFFFFWQVCNGLTVQAYFMRNYRARFCGSSATRVDHIVARELSRSLMVLVAWACIQVPRLWMAQVEVRKAVGRRACCVHVACTSRKAATYVVSIREYFSLGP